MKFNFNDYIKVKLNNSGFDILFKDYKEDVDSMKRIPPDWNFEEYLRFNKYNDEEQTITIQIWKFINLFGAEFLIGRNEYPFDFNAELITVVKQ
jgi:hypothetical protein